MCGLWLNNMSIHNNMSRSRYGVTPSLNIREVLPYDRGHAVKGSTDYKAIAEGKLVFLCQSLNRLGMPHDRSTVQQLAGHSG